MMGRGGVEISLGSFFMVGRGRLCSNRFLRCGLFRRHSSCMRGGMLVSPCDQSIRSGYYVLSVTQNGMLKGKSEELKWKFLCTGIPKMQCHATFTNPFFPPHRSSYLYLICDPRLLLLTTCGCPSNLALQEIYCICLPLRSYIHKIRMS